jgi:Tfp pilus assembly protein PilF
MSTKYFCAHCDKEFVPEEPGDRPRCPQCMRKGGVEPVQEAGPKTGASRRWAVIIAVLIVAAGIGYGFYVSTTVALEETPPLRPLEPRELSAYLERDQIQVGLYEPMMMLPDHVDEWPESAVEIAERMHSQSSSWSLEQPLPRELMTADQTLAMMDAHEERVKLYPLELATAMTALLRQRGVNAMVAEVWEFEGARAPADPSGTLGYFVTAVYDQSGPEEPSVYVDAWGGRGEVNVSSVRVLRDTEVLAAALGTEAIRMFKRSGDGKKALPMIETALLLDPMSPALRAVNATILVESGGIAQGVTEFEAALQLRADGPRKLNLAQLYLAQAGTLEVNGQQAAADAQFSEANRIVDEVIETWPRYSHAHLVLATIYMGLGDPERARLELELAESLSPDTAMLWAVWAQYHLAQSDPSTAAAKMKRAVVLDPNNWQLRLQAARVFQVAGDDEAATENVDAALQLVPAEKRTEVRQLADRMMGPRALTNSPEPEQGTPQDPALMLGDPSNLRLRDPGETLQLDLDQ